MNLADQIVDILERKGAAVFGISAATTGGLAFRIYRDFGVSACGPAIVEACRGDGRIAEHPADLCTVWRLA